MMNDPLLSPQLAHLIRGRFIGREDALNLFYSRPAYRSMQNGVYYYGSGGTGKTWLLRKIIADNQNVPGLKVTDIIDFYDIKNNTLHGLQRSIMERLDPDNSGVFDPFKNLLKNLRKERQWSDENKVNYSFITCCQEAVTNREVVLLMDTFERVQGSYAGSWLLETFLPEVRGLVVVLAGRPEPQKAEMPYNIVEHALRGFSLPEADLYIRQQSSISDTESIETIHKRTNGLPLLIELVLDLPSPVREQFIERLDALPEDVLIEQDDSLKRELVGQFAAPVNNYNRVMWAMSHLWRRFDLPMLRFLTENSTWFQPSDYDWLVDNLSKSVYIKQTQVPGSHLLHDEIRKWIASYILNEAADPVRALRSELNQCIVRKYYNQVIAVAESAGNVIEANELHAEQIGYILEEDLEAGLALYVPQLDHKNFDMDYEELLWGEVREHAVAEDDRWQEIYQRRVIQLRHHNLFDRAEYHYHDMISHFTKEYGSLSMSLAYMIFQQGRLEDAGKEYDKIVRYAQEHPGAINLARLENNLGMFERAVGRWDNALEHFNQGVKEAIRRGDQEALIDIFINRGNLYSLMGKFEEALLQCSRAITQLEALPKGDFKTLNFRQHRIIYAYRNLGVVHRHKLDYTEALKMYQTSLDYATVLGDQTGICDSLQHVGITQHLLGRQLRRSGKDIKQALTHQIEAWYALNKAIDIAGRANWLPAIANGLNRLAKVYREVNYFTHNPRYFLIPPLTVQLDAEAQARLARLEEKLNSFDNTFELEYLDELLIKNRLFTELEDPMQKSERLFEVSAIIADEVSDTYRSLDSLTEAARLLMWMKKFSEAEIIIRRIRRLPGFESQQEVFTAIADMTQAHLDFVQENHAAALEQFTESFSRLANCAGYASYLLTDRLRDLEWRLRDLPKEQSLEWCDVLEERWGQTRALDQKPEMRDMLERIRMEKYSLPSQT